MAPAQRRLASYLLEHVSTAPDLGITDLAEEAGVSVGTISCCAGAWGCGATRTSPGPRARGGLRSAARSRRSAAGGGRRTRWRRPSHGSSARARRRSRRPRASWTGRAGLRRGAHRRARRVEWVGVGSAGLVAAEGALKLRKLGVDSVAHFDGHQQAMSAALLGERDMLIAVSHSGRTTDVVESVRVAGRAAPSGRHHGRGRVAACPAGGRGAGHGLLRHRVPGGADGLHARPAGHRPAAVPGLSRQGRRPQERLARTQARSSRVT